MGNQASASTDEDKPQELPTHNVRDMSAVQLARYDGSGEKGACIVALASVIFDVTHGKSEIEAEYGTWFGKNKTEALQEEVDQFKEKYPVLGKVIELKDFTPEELLGFRGENGTPIYIAARGYVFDVSSGESFYGPGGGYHLFAGHNAQRALALMSLDVKDVENTNLDDLEEKDLKILDDWITKYFDKYPHIGTLVESQSETQPKSEPKTEETEAQVASTADGAPEDAPEPAPSAAPDAPSSEATGTEKSNE
mmetsp:Transcript_20282/g.37679  ORF Transcript_20282/g.37679 Transcript_20282/m.37679 type:complete len:252 (-) Transcript_20282:61-816(-)